MTTKTKPTTAQLLAFIHSNGRAIEKMEQKERKNQETIERLQSFQRHKKLGRVW